MPDDIDATALANRRSANVALLGVLSRHLPIDIERWQAAIRANLAENLWEANLAAFDLGRGA